YAAIAGREGAASPRSLDIKDEGKTNGVGMPRSQDAKERPPLEASQGYCSCEP
ncbi:MAG: hypothetical protein ACI9MF_002518, partial [Gammaproteobacteria bacterium]